MNYKQRLLKERPKLKIVKGMKKRTPWDILARPGVSYQNFKQARTEGVYAKNLTWRHRCAAHRKRIRKNKIARLARRGSTRRILKRL
jgi:hypothetical protein